MPMAAAMDVLVSLGVGGGVGLYAGGYVLTIFLLGGLLVSALGGHLSYATLDGRDLELGWVRWAVVLVVTNLAGLPPFLFFGCKVGLLSAAVASVGLTCLSLLLLYIFGGWVVYFNLIQALALGQRLGTQRPRGGWGRPLVTALVCQAFVVVSLTLGLAVFDELCLWLSL
jgi:formate hydrogenlyase subunit 3/multisubunit Na+/H+ antiporter MnhD subunit